MMTGVKKSKSIHYVDNKKFLSAMIEFKELYNIAEKNKELRPPVSDYIGECFLKIATHLSYRPNFINYTYREDMISDGIENCLQYVQNFNTEKSNNPFAYFTQIIYYAFIRRIEKEKKQLYIKYKTMDMHGSLDDNVTLSKHDTADGHGDAPMTVDQKANMYDFIATFESKKKKRKVQKKKSTTSTLEYFFAAA